MAPSKTKSRTQRQPSAPAEPPQQTDHVPSISRDNDSLNLAVLQRHNPSIISILSIAPYAVIYTFNATAQTWDKSGCEGTLFVCQLAPIYEEAHDQEDGMEGIARFEVVVLNRRGMENFSFALETADSIEITEEYVLLQGEADTVEGDETDGPNTAQLEKRPVVYGVWIFAEPPPSSTSEMRTINARVMQECAALAEASRARVAEGRRVRNEQALPVLEEDSQAVPMGRQLSLREMFDQQRRSDGGWSVQSHGPPSHPVGDDTGEPLSAREGSSNGLGAQSAAKPQMSQSQNALLSLFNKAKQDYRGNG
ncbi:MAG: hypothetical protein M1828_003998 [Chrysothrix sp. TS-e1954]|nr:MAG: hypothetical protein M1828_003998 [Chrysothrix sp. TS-e1954]